MNDGSGVSGPEFEAAKWNLAIASSVNYRCAFPTEFQIARLSLYLVSGAHCSRPHRVRLVGVFDMLRVGIHASTY